MEKRTGQDRHVSSARMVLGDDLNHHDTLFAGKASLYIVECGFLAVQDFLQTNHIVCLGLDGFRFLRSVHKGTMIDLKSTIVHAGTSSVGVYVEMDTFPDRKLAAEGFLSFVHINEADGSAVPHHVTLAAADETTAALRSRYQIVLGKKS